MVGSRSLNWSSICTNSNNSLPTAVKPPVIFALNSPLIVLTSPACSCSSAVSCSAVACLSGTSSRVVNRPQPGRIPKEKVKSNKAERTLSRLFTFSLLLFPSGQYRIERVSDFMDPDQFNTLDLLQLRHVPFRQQATFESHLRRLANPQLSLTDRPNLSPQPDLSHHERRKIDRALAQARRDRRHNAQVDGRLIDVDPADHVHIDILPREMHA